MKNNKNKSEHKEKRSLDDQSLSKASGGIMDVVAYGFPQPKTPNIKAPNIKDINSGNIKEFNNNGCTNLAYGNPHLQQPVPQFPKKDKNSNSNLGNDFNSPYFNPNSNN